MKTAVATGAMDLLNKEQGNKIEKYVGGHEYESEEEEMG